MAAKEWLQADKKDIVLGLFGAGTVLEGAHPGISKMINNPWILYSVGVLFCMAGLFLFHRNVFEENGRILGPVLVIIAGVILIGVGAAKSFHLY